MADEVVSHAFSHGFHPEHSERLAAYWAQALGGPTTFSAAYGDETSVVQIHSGNGPHEEMDRRAITCFDQALEDIALAGDDRLHQVLHDYFNRPGVEPSEAIIENWWRQGMMGGAKAHYDGIVAFSQTDFTEDLKKITVPVLVMHGEDDQIVPYADSGPLSAALVQNGTLKSYKGFPHGMPTTEAPTIDADLLAFIQS